MGKLRLAIAATLLSTTAFAGDNDNGVANMAKDEEQVIVLGSKIGSTIQELPSSVTVLTEDFIHDSRIETITDIDNYVPNLKFSQLGEVGDRYISIRGISSNPLIENRVAVYIDDVPYRTINDQLLVDISQIEVLRGPQGALYGANTEGGVIVVNTAPIQSDFRLRSSLSTESFNGGMNHNYSLTASGAITDTLSGRFALSGKKGDAYSINIDPTREDGDFDDKAFLASLFFNPTEDLEVNFQVSGEFNRADGIYEQGYVPINRDLYNSLFAQANPTFEALFGVSQINERAVDEYEYHTDGVREFDEDEWVSSLKVAYAFDFANLISVSSFRDHEERGYGAEFEFTSFPLVNTGGEDGREEIYQELRLVSQQESDLEWIVGLSYLDSDRSFNVESKDKIAGETEFRALPPLLQGSTDTSIFGNVRLPFFDDKLGLSFGARWERATRSVEREEPGIFTVGGQAAAVFPILSAEEDFTEFLPKISVDYALTDDVRLYTSAASGWQPGGFNDDAFVEGVAADFTRYQSESIVTYEVGVKAKDSEHNLVWSLAAFYTEADDWQEFNYVLDGNGVAQSTGLVVNADKLISQGVEAEVNWSPISSLQIISGFGYTDAEYDRFEFTDSQSFTGNKVLLTPKFTANLVMDYQHASGWFARTEITAYGDMYLNPDNTAKQDDYQLIGGSLGWRDDNYTVALYVENLTDEYYFNGQAFTDFTFATPDLFFSTPGKPRAIGLQVTTNW